MKAGWKDRGRAGEWRQPESMRQAGRIETGREDGGRMGGWRQGGRMEAGC
jgi:hypothetical protein